MIQILLFLLSLLLFLVVSVDIVTLSPYVWTAFASTIRCQSYHHHFHQQQQQQQQRYDHTGSMHYKTHQSSFRIYTYSTTGSNPHNIDDPDHHNTTATTNSSSSSSSASLDSNSNNISSNNNSNITVLRNNNNNKSSTATTNTWNGYMIVDSRDALPFQIQVHTPPDYHTRTMALPSSTSTKTTTAKNDERKKKKSHDTTTMLSSVYQSNEGSDDNKNKNNDNYYYYCYYYYYTRKKNNKKKKDMDDTDALLPQKLGDCVLDATTTTTGDTIFIHGLSCCTTSMFVSIYTTTFRIVS